jgi:hypothetical protein
MVLKFENNSSVTINELQQLLRHLAVSYHSAQTDFCMAFGKAIKKTVHRNVFNKIMDGQIKFERGEWAEYLPIAFHVANLLLEKHDDKIEQRKIKMIESNPDLLYKSNNLWSEIEEKIDFAVHLYYNAGDTTLGINILISLYRLIDIDSLSIIKPHLYIKFYHICANTQMQRGIHDGELGTLKCLEKCISALEKLEKEKVWLWQVLHLKGIVQRQRFDFQGSMKTYKGLEILADRLPLSEKEKIDYKFSAYKETAIVLTRWSEYKNEITISPKAKLLINNSYEHLKYSNIKTRFDLVKLRKAETLLKFKGYLSEIETILDEFEDPIKLVSLSKPIIVAFYKINTERYLAINNMDLAYKYFKAGLDMASKEAYNHNLISLNNVLRNNIALQRILPKDFLNT